jgi:hypothetical protein
MQGFPKLLEDTIKLASKNKVTIRLIGKPKVIADGAECNGFFSDNPLELVVACGQPEHEWILTYIHESSHMDQFLEDSELWDTSVTKDKDASEIFFDWLDGKRTNMALVKKSMRKLRDVELDCEKRSVKKIKKYKINSINIEEYIQKANAYIFSYTYLLESRKWVQGIYFYEDVIKHSPKKFLKNPKDYDKIPQELREAFDRVTNMAK